MIFIVCLVGFAIWPRKKVQVKPIDTQPAIPTHLISKDGPEIFFPMNVRVKDYQVNKFVFDFLKAMVNSNYKEYRLLVTQMREPVSMDKFEEAYGRVKSITVTKVVRIDDPKVLESTGLTNCSLPAYRIESHVVFRNQVERNIKIYTFRESGRWVSSN